MHGAGDVLDLLIAQIVECEILDLAHSVAAHPCRDANPAGSISMPSPVVLTIRPPCSATSGSAAARYSRSIGPVPASSSSISRL
jgi:hypothetical protein